MPDYGAIYDRITRSGSKANLYFMWLRYKKEHRLSVHAVLPLRKYTKVDKTGVTYLDEHGEEQFIPADLVVLSGGTAAVPDKCAAFYGAGTHLHFIGDCYRAGDVHKAVTAGWAVANQI